MHKIGMLGAGLIGRFYTMSLLGYRGKDEIKVICAAHPEEAAKFAKEFNIPRSTTDMAEAIRDPEVDTVVIGLPNYLHKKAALLAAEAGKAVLCTKPLATSGPEALEMLEAVEKAGVFHGYLEDLVYTPKHSRRWHAAQKGRPGQGAVGALARDPRRTRTAIGSGPSSFLAAARLSIWAAIASKLHAISSARKTARSK